jgi:hypothetical protein
VRVFVQVTPVFPPYDLPTWTSLATGLYPATTGKGLRFGLAKPVYEFFMTENPQE